MLGKYLIIDAVQFPNPVTGTLAMMLNPAENVYQTEDGKEAANILRLDRPSWTATFNCSSTQKDALLQICKNASCTVTIAGQEMTGRMRLNGNYTLVENSERTEGTSGLWVVPVKFEGF